MSRMFGTALYNWEMDSELPHTRITLLTPLQYNQNNTSQLVSVHYALCVKK